MHSEKLRESSEKKAVMRAVREMTVMKAVTETVMMRAVKKAVKATVMRDMMRSAENEAVKAENVTVMRVSINEVLIRLY